MIRRIISIVILSLLITSCGAAAPAATEAPPVVNVQPGNYCQIASKVQWSVRDTPETINGVRRESAKIDKLCSELRIVI